MPRPREFEPREALERAVDLFWEKGFGASIDDVVASTGASRHSLYGMFGSKRELYLRALERYWADRQTDTFLPLKRRGAGLKAIRTTFDGVLQFASTHADARGCLVCDAAAEVAPHDPEVQMKVHEIFGQLTALFRAALERAVELGELKGQQDLDALAAYLTTIFQSLAFMYRSGYSHEALAQHVKVALRVLH